MDEAIYHDELEGVTKLLGHLTKLDVENGNPGTLNKPEFTVCKSSQFVSLKSCSLQLKLSEAVWHQNKMLCHRMWCGVDWSIALKLHLSSVPSFLLTFLFL